MRYGAPGRPEGDREAVRFVKPLRAASGQIAFGSFGKNGGWADRDRAP
jgi:hypothetical protein